MTRQLVAIPGRAGPCRAGPCCAGLCRAGPRGRVSRLTANCALADSPGLGVASPLAPPGRTAATRPVIATNDAAASASRRCRTALDAMAVSPKVGSIGRQSQATPGPQLLRPERLARPFIELSGRCIEGILELCRRGHDNGPRGLSGCRSAARRPAARRCVAQRREQRNNGDARMRRGPFPPSCRGPPAAACGHRFLRGGLCSPKFPRSANSGRSKRIILSPWLGPPGRGQIGGRWMSRRASPARWRIRHEGGHACSL